jgi:hypothetical protein
MKVYVKQVRLVADYVKGEWWNEKTDGRKVLSDWISEKEGKKLRKKYKKKRHYLKPRFEVRYARIKKSELMPLLEKYKKKHETLKSGDESFDVAIVKELEAEAVREEGRDL